MYNPERQLLQIEQHLSANKPIVIEIEKMKLKNLFLINIKPI